MSVCRLAWIVAVAEPAEWSWPRSPRAASARIVSGPLVAGGRTNAARAGLRSVARARRRLVTFVDGANIEIPVALGPLPCAACMLLLNASLVWLCVRLVIQFCVCLTL